jgi:G3E family GTPase
VLVESSGVADPATLAARLHRAVRHPGQAGGLLHVLDARAWADDDTLLDPAALARADLVALTKTDLPGSVPVAEARRRLEPLLRTGVPVVDAPHGALDPELFADASAPLNDGPRQLSLAEALPLPGGHQHVHASTWEHDGLVHPRRLAELLDGGLPEAYRLKGVVRLDVPWGARWWTVHRVGGLPRVTPAPRPAPTSRLVALGPTLDERAAEVALTHVGRDPQEEVAPDDHAALMRWVPDDLRPEWARVEG